MISTVRPLQVIVVAYHGSDELGECLSALEGEVECTVVDNSSSDEVRAVTRRRGADYIDAGKNLGFAAGVNLALEPLAAGLPTDVVLINPDAVLTPPNLERLVAHLHSPGNERVAATSPRLVGVAGDEQRVYWPFPSPVRAWAEAFGLGRLPARSGFVIGAVLALRWEAILEAGLFDRQFFLYAEEVDWQRRALDLGWRSCLCPAAVAHHLGGGSSSNPLRREELFHAAHETYIRKWHGSVGWLIYRSAVCVGAAARALVLVGERRSQAARRAHLYLRGPIRCAAAVRD